jgi:hypothetical protein
VRVIGVVKVAPGATREIVKEKGSFTLRENVDG